MSWTRSAMSESRRRLAALALALALALLPAGCGGGGEVHGDANADPLGAVPADAVLYAQVTVHPAGDQREAAESAFGKLLGRADPGARLVQLLDRADPKHDEA